MCDGGIEKNPSLVINVCHHSASLVMPIGDHRDRFFYPTLTPIKDPYALSNSILNRLYVHSSIAIILMEKRELVALLNLSSWCLVMVEWLFLAVPCGCLRFVIVVLPDHTHVLFLALIPSEARKTLILIYCWRWRQQ